MNSVFLKIFEALNDAGINYCLLRGYDELERYEGYKEVDLLVAAEHLPRLARVLAAKSFAPLPSWGYAPHHFFVAYDHADDTWVKFDVVTELRYGKPIRALRLEMAERYLHGSRWRESMYVPSPEDEFITLLLHCLLDKAGFKRGHRTRLVELDEQIGNDQAESKQLAEHVKRFLAPALPWDTLIQAIRSDDWLSLIGRRSAVARQLFLRDPIFSIWRSVSGWLLRRMRPLFFAVHRRGLAVALLAPDDAGKSTLARALAQDAQLRARPIYTGTNVEAEGIGFPTSRWLHRRVKSLEGTHARMRPDRIALKGLRFVNRLLEQWYRLAVATFCKLCGKFVIFDRYVYDSWLTKRRMTPWKRLRRWLLEAAWPMLDLVIMLDAPGQLLYQRKGEHTPEWLEQQRLAYIGLKEHIRNMIVVDATRDANEIRREVTALIWKHYRTRIYGAETSLDTMNETHRFAAQPGLWVEPVSLLRPSSRRSPLRRDVQTPE